MSKTILKIRSFATGAFLALAFALALPGMASAGEQTLTAGFSLTPQSGQFLNNGFTPANWTVDNSVATVDPLEPEILPTKKIDLTLPPSGQMTFNPGNLAVCPDSAVNPGNVSVPVPTIVARCPDAVIGNGTAKFVLNRNNLSPQAVLDGVVVVGRDGGEFLEQLSQVAVRLQAVGLGGIHLVLHQRNQRTDHHAQSVEHMRRKLVAQRLSAARRHHRKDITARQNLRNNLLLIRPEASKSKHPMQSVMNFFVHSHTTLTFG